MAKKIQYQFLSAQVELGTEEKPDIRQIFLDKTMTYSQENEAIAKKEAWNGIYEIVEDEEETKATLENRVDILESDSEELREALDMILSGVTQ